MGAWGTGSFENDDASDWLSEFIESGSEKDLEAAFSKIISDGEAYLEAPDCCTAIAAAEVVTAMSGKPSPTMPAESKSAIKQDKGKSERLVSVALQAVGRIKAESELKELWAESDDFEAWQAAVSELESRLSS